MQHIGVQATGTQLPHISTNDVESAYLPLPPLEEQHEIIRIVSKSLDAMAQIACGLCESNSALDKLDQSILAKAFRGELVPQDSNDEPAATLLKRIRDSRARPLVKVKTRGKIIRVTKRNSAMTKSRFDADVKGQAYLAKLISSKGKIALTAEELLQISQLPLPDFYKQLDFEVTQKMLLEREGRLESANAT
jgi:type I restriction enzyme S subunit